MKKIFALVAVVTLAACAGKKSDDKRAELDKLKKQQSELSAKIRDLEKQIAVNDTTGGKTKLVEVTTVQPQPFSHYIDIQGKVDADQNVTISSQMPGSVKAVYAKEGDNVSAGQVLAEVDDQVMRQGVEELKTQLALAQQLYTKQENLWKQNIGSEVQYLQAKTQKEALEQKMKTMQEQLALYRITAPVSGTVDEVNVKLGQVVAPGLPLFRVVNMSRLKVKAEVAERYASTVKEGSDVIVFFPDLKKEVTGKITFRSEVINSLNRTFNVQVALDENNRDYHPNMIATLKITDYKTPNALVVPLNTVQQSEDGDYVYVADNANGKTIAKKVPVKTGQAYDGNVEIVSGLQVGDKIVTTGFDELNTGVLLSVNETKHDTTGNAAKKL